MKLQCSDIPLTKDLEPYRLVLDFFKGDAMRAQAWFHTPNPLLGDVEPCVLLAARPEKLLKFVKDCLEGNFP